MKQTTYLNRFLLTAGMFFLIHAGASAEERWVKAGFVNKQGLVHAAPSEKIPVYSGAADHFKVIGELSSGQKVTVYERKNRWVRISPNADAVTQANRQEQWINAAYVKNGVVDTGNVGAQLAVRSGPGLNYSLLDKLSAGQKVTAYETRDGWIRISPNAAAAVSQSAGQNRWINAAYVKNGAVDTGSPGAKLAVRSGPGLNYTLLDRLSSGQKVIVCETKDGWVRISANNTPAAPSSASVQKLAATPVRPPIKVAAPVVSVSKPVAAPTIVSTVTDRPVVQTSIQPPVDNLVLSGDFSGMALALPSAGGNSTAELSGRWLCSSGNSWAISPKGGNLGAYVRAPASAEPARLLYLAGDGKRSTGQYVLRFDYILNSPSDALGVKVFVSDRDITIGTDGGDFHMNSSQRPADLVALPGCASWSTYNLPVELGGGYNYIYVLFMGSGAGNTGIDNVRLTPIRH